jgi:hypothetical protein
MIWCSKYHSVILHNASELHTQSVTVCNCTLSHRSATAQRCSVQLQTTWTHSVCIILSSCYIMYVQQVSTVRGCAHPHPLARELWVTANATLHAMSFTSATSATAAGAVVLWQCILDTLIGVAADAQCSPHAAAGKPLLFSAYSIP